MPIATGAALSAKVRKSGQVAACFFGDGASNEGTFHESLNLASAFSLPVVFVCENNLYAMPGVVVDGNDVIAVYEAAVQAGERARTGGGPTLIECKTYRWRTHFEGEPDTYRPPEELKAWMDREPIQPYCQKLVAQGILTAAEIEQMEQAVVRELDAAVEFARQSPFPEPETALQDLWA
jgi:pyruvate dehydrogenase E1 component alpha subunit